jgi:hypothetical protein
VNIKEAKRDSRRREKELSKLFATIDYVKSGKCDHMFADAETKAVFLADLDAQMIALINAEVDARPDIYKRHPDGRISLLEREVIPLSR